MSFIKNIKIGGKLSFGFCVNILGLVVVVIVAVTSISLINRDNSNIMDYPMAQYLTVNDIELELMNLRRILVLAALNTGNIDEINELEGEIAVARARAVSNINVLRQSFIDDPFLSQQETDERLRQIHLLENLMYIYIDGFAPAIIDLARIGQPTSGPQLLALNLINEAGSGLFFNVYSEFSSLHNSIQGHMNHAFYDIETSSQNTLVTMIILAIGVMIFGAVIAYFVTRMITRPVSDVVYAIKNVADGNLNVNLKADTKDEVGILAGSAQQLVATLKRLINDMDNMASDHEKGEIDTFINAESFNGEYGTVALKLNDMIKSALNTQNKVVGTFIKIADGDFEADMEKLPGKKAMLNDAVNDMRNHILSVHEEISVLIDAAANKGNLSVSIDESKYSGGWLKIMEELNFLARVINKPIAEIKDVISRLGQYGKLDRRIEGEYAGDFLIIKDVVNTTMNNLSEIIDDVSDTLVSVAKGDLTKNITREYLGDFDPIKKSVNSIVSRLNETVEDISQVAEGVRGGSVQLSQSSMDLAEGTNKQMMAVQEMSDGVSVIDEQAKDNADNAKKAADLAVTSKENAETGNEEMKSLLAAMERISKSSGEISQIIKTIESIAFQTNLLALNAAVEAARAGEMGRGFSVVAEEVRNLAARSADAAKETTSLIEESITNVQDGTQAASDTAASLEKIMQNISDVSDVVYEIFESSNKQTTALGGINDDLGQIANVAQTAASSSEETAAAAEELDSQVEILKEKLSFFTTSTKDLTVRKVWDVTTSERIDTTSLMNAPGNHLTFNANESIVTEGELADTMYFVLEGTVKVVKSYGTLNARELAILKKGDLFGEMALFLNEPRSASVVANSDVKVVQIHRDIVMQFMEKSPDAACVIVETLCARLKNVLSNMGSY